MQINRQSYEEFFLLYADGELNETEKKSVEQFVAANPDLADEFLLIRDTIMQPDESIFFENKEVLYRNEEDNRKIVYMRWFRIAAAAVVVLALSIVGWLFVDNKAVRKQPVAEVQKPMPAPRIESKEQSVPDTKKEINASVETSETKQKTMRQKTATKHEAIEHAQQNLQAQQTEPLNEPDVDLAKNISVPSVKHSALTSAPVNVTVQPHELEESDVPVPTNADYAQSFDQDNDKSDMIYFANTTISKKTKFRGVLRKATRYLDRVTSLQ